jgi:hypothetical protein
MVVDGLPWPGYLLHGVVSDDTLSYTLLSPFFF